MSDSDESGVTHTEISNPFEDLSDIGSPGVVRPEHEGLPLMLDDGYVQVTLQAPPSPNYKPGPEEPQSPPLLDFVLEPVYLVYIPQEDEVFPNEEQPLPVAASPTTQSPDYVLESDPEADPEEDADGGDDGDDKDESLEDDDFDIEADDDEEEEEEHPALADSTAVALPAADQAPFAKETKSFETDESAATPPSHPAYRVTARISIPVPVPTPVWSDAEVARLLAISTPSSLPLSPWSSALPQIPSPPLPQIPSPPLPVSSPVHVLSPSPPASPIRPLGYRAAMIRLRVEAASTSHSLPLPPPIILSNTRPDAPSSGTPPLYLLSIDHREDRPEVTLPPRKRLGIILGPRYEFGESSSAASRPARGLRTDYGFVATMDREIRRDLERDVELMSRYVVRRCKVFGHVLKECPKNIGAGAIKNFKKTSQTPKGIPVGQKIEFKPKQVFQPFSKKSTANTCGKKKNNSKSTKKVSKSNLFEVLTSVDNDVDLGKLRFVDDDGNSLVPIGIVDSDSEVKVVFDETANLRLSTSGKDVSDKGYGTNSLLEQCRNSYPDNDDYDPYDDDMYENHDMSEYLQSICYNLDITVRGRKKK
ncbi:hypothetical protein Tco_0661301 [Tanacetum coccineum]